MKPQTKRRLGIASAALALLAFLGCGGCCAWGWTSSSAFRENVAAVFEEPEFATISDADGAWRYLQAHQGSVSLVVYSVDESGQPIPGTELRYLDEQRRVLASTMKVMVLDAYVRTVAAGHLDAAEPIPHHDWDSWYVPGTDGGAHAAAYSRLGVEHQGGTATGSGSSPLSDVVDSMIRHSDNAATDVVLDRLGPHMAEALVGRDHDPIGPIKLAFNNALGEDDPCLGEVVQRAETALSMPTLPEQRRRIACVLPRGTAADYASVHAQVVSGAQSQPGWAHAMYGPLSWPMGVGNNAKRFERFGSKGGSVPGVLTDTMHLVPLKGDFADQRRVVVLFIEDMSITAWLALMSSFAHQQLMVELATDSARVEQVRSEVERW